MTMTLAEIRLKQNPILTNLLLGMGQGSFAAEKLFPRLPQSLSSVMLAKVGDERFRKYNLRRAPGRVNKSSYRWPARFRRQNAAGPAG